MNFPETIDQFKDFIRENLYFYRQPIHCIKPPQFCPVERCRFEVLSRLKSDDCNIVKFIEFAEQMDWTIYLDAYVLKRVFKHLNQSGDRAHYSINLSARTLSYNSKFSQWLGDCVDIWGVDPQRIKLELTETAPLKDLAHAIALAEFWTSKGGGFAIDDVGAGYVSTGYLRKIPLTMLKIDREIVRGITSSEFERISLEYFCRIARCRHARITAEGVEDQETLDALQSFGVDYAQGYFLGMPEPWF